jgi:anti-sigma factor RsiW
MMATDAEFKNTACAKYESLLEDYLSGELNVADAKSAAEHWKSCAGCREALEAAAASTRLLRAAAPSPEPSPAFARTVMARIRAAQEQAAERASFWQPFVSVGWRFAATATLALVAMLTYDAGWGNRSQPNIAEVRPTVVHDIFSPEPAGPDEGLLMVAETTHGNN